MKNFLEKKWLLPVIVLTAIILRLIPAICAAEDPSRLIRPDSGIYLDSARELVESGTYPTTRRPPGYPLFAAMIFACGGNNFAIALIQTLISAAACGITALAGREYGGKACGNLAALLMALNLTAIANAPLLLSDTLFSLFAAGQFYFFARYIRRKTLREILLLALTAGIACLIRPINQLIIVVIALLTAIMPQLTWQKKLSHILAAFAVFSAVITPWMLRNHLVGATFAIDTNTGAMRHQNGAMLLAKVNGTNYELEKEKLRRQEAEEFADKNKYPDERSRERWRLAQFRSMVLRHPLTYAAQHFDLRILLPDAPSLLESFGLTTSDRGTMNVLKKEGIFAAVRHYFGAYWLLYILLLLPLLVPVMILYAGTGIKIFQCAKNIRRQWFELFILLGFAEYYLFLPGAITAPRYQLPALPCMCVLAAGAIIWICCRKNEDQLENPSAPEV